MDVLRLGNLQRVSFCFVSRDHVGVLDLDDRSSLPTRMKEQLVPDLQCPFFDGENAERRMPLVAICCVSNSYPS